MARRKRVSVKIRTAEEKSAGRTLALAGGLTQLRAGQSLIDLVAVDGEIGRKGGAAPGKKGHNMDHLCLRIEPFDASALLAHLVSNGVGVGEIKSRYGADGYGPSLYVSDPEGNVVELKGPPTRAGAWAS